MDKEYTIEVDECKVYFSSDFHLSHSRLEQRYKNKMFKNRNKRIFFDIIERIGNTQSILFILGDLFSYWHERRGFFPIEFKAELDALQNAVNKGAKIYVLRGNRDFLLGEEFEKHSGAVVLDSPLIVVLKGRKFGLDHGNGLLRSNFVCRSIRNVLRSNILTNIIKRLPPFMVTDMGYAYSILREVMGNRRENFPRINLAPLPEEDFKDCDALIFGHMHKNTKISYIGNYLKCSIYTVGGIDVTGRCLCFDNGELYFKNVCDIDS